MSLAQAFDANRWRANPASRGHDGIVGKVRHRHDWNLKATLEKVSNQDFTQVRTPTAACSQDAGANRQRFQVRLGESAKLFDSHVWSCSPFFDCADCLKSCRIASRLGLHRHCTHDRTDVVNGRSETFSPSNNTAWRLFGQNARMLSLVTPISPLPAGESTR